MVLQHFTFSKVAHRRAPTVLSTFVELDNVEIVSFSTFHEWRSRARSGSQHFVDGWMWELCRHADNRVSGSRCQVCR